MAFIFVNDPTDLNSNSYCSVTEANDYHETVHPSLKAIWDALTSESQERALVAATRMIDDQFVWISPSSITNTNQALQFPRQYLYRQGKNATNITFESGLPENSISTTGSFFPNNIYPDFLKNATAELARTLFSGATSPTLKNTQNDLSKVKAGSVEVAFKDKALQATDGPVPGAVIDMLNRWADFKRPALTSTGSSIRTIPLLRG